jgi:hypothetical protein
MGLLAPNHDFADSSIGPPSRKLRWNLQNEARSLLPKQGLKTLLPGRGLMATQTSIAVAWNTRGYNTVPEKEGPRSMNWGLRRTRIQVLLERFNGVGEFS